MLRYEDVMQLYRADDGVCRQWNVDTAVVDHGVPPAWQFVRLSEPNDGQRADNDTHDSVDCWRTVTFAHGNYGHSRSVVDLPLSLSLKSEPSYCHQFSLCILTNT